MFNRSKEQESEMNLLRVFTIYGYYNIPWCNNDGVNQMSTIETLTAAFKVVDIKTPQLIGIIAGCIVFTITISVVIYLLIASGTLQRAFVEIQQGSKGGSKEEVMPVDSTPQLYEHLLEAAATLPITPSVAPSVGTLVTVRPLQDGDVSDLVAASNGSALFGESAYDPLRIWHWLSTPTSQALAIGNSIPSQSEDTFRRIFLVNPAGNNFCHLSIIDSVLRKPVGMISLVDNQPSNLSIRIDNVWVAIAFQGKKVVYDAMRLVLRSLFLLGYRRVTMEVNERHPFGKKFAMNCGFMLEAVLRKHRIVNKRNLDSCLFSLLNSEWEEAELKLKRKLGIPLKESGQKIAEIETVTGKTQRMEQQIANRNVGSSGGDGAVSVKSKKGSKQIVKVKKK